MLKFTVVDELKNHYIIFFFCCDLTKYFYRFTYIDILRYNIERIAYSFYKFLF